MRVEGEPATIVVCCGAPEGVPAGEVAGWVRSAARAGLPVTWAASPAGMPAVLDCLETVGPHVAAGEIALAVDAAALASRPRLRREISASRAVTGELTCAVAGGCPSVDHRSLLVELGIHTLAVGGFDAVVRSNRRPPPPGWPCRSVVWGLWEVRTVARLPRSAAGRLVPWAFAPRVPAGSLTVVHVEPGECGARSVPAALERLAGWVSRRPDRVRAVPLSSLQGMLLAVGQRDSGSVLRRAA